MYPLLDIVDRLLPGPLYLRMMGGWTYSSAAKKEEHPREREVALLDKSLSLKKGTCGNFKRAEEERGGTPF